MMIRIALLSTAIVVGMAATDEAQARGFGGGQMERPSFADLDTNGDGTISAEEFAAFPATRMAERFAAADTDGDGKLSKEELANVADERRAERREMRLDRMIERLDTDGDGFVSEEEMTAMVGKMGRGAPGERFIERFDTDKDGVISAEEYAEAEKFMQMNGKKGRDGKGGKGGGRGERGGDRAPFWRN